MKKIRSLVVVLTLVSCISSVFCNTKTVNVKLDKGYTNGVFNIIYDTEVANCTGNIESPLGRVYECVSQESGYMYCQIDNIESGEWKINLSSDNEIGKVTVNLSANNEITDDKDGNISIVRKITGLNAYLENRTIKAEWTDEKCGEVLVIVSDSATKKTLDSNIVKGEYSYEIPIGYENVSITLVPTSLASKEEAKTSYTFSLSDVPEIEVIHDIGLVTNKDEVQFEVNTSEQCTYTSFLNGKENINTDKLLFSTVDGVNKIKIIATNSKGHRATYEYEFEKDTEAPVLTLDNDWSGFVTSERTVVVSGKAQNAVKIVINDVESAVNESGTFNQTVQLKDGMNEVKVIAMDEAGNESLFIMNIQKNVKSSNNFLSDAIFVIIIVAAIFFAVFFFGKKKGPKEKKSDKKTSKKSSSVMESRIKSKEKEVHEEPTKKETIKEEIAEKKQSEVENKNNNSKPKKEKKKKEEVATNGYSRKKNNIFEYVIWILTIILIVSVTQFVVRIDVVQSNSMEPNIMTGELVFTNRLVSGDDIERGDIITFEVDNTALCKRVVGMEGDVVSFSQGYVVINGEYCKELYLSEDVETNSLKTFTVPKDCFLCLGDNREVSYDARNWDNPYVQKNNIYGKVVLHIPFLNIFK